MLSQSSPSFLSTNGCFCAANFCVEPLRLHVNLSKTGSFLSVAVIIVILPTLNCGQCLFRCLWMFESHHEHSHRLACPSSHQIACHLPWQQETCMPGFCVMMIAASAWCTFVAIGSPSAPHIRRFLPDRNSKLADNFHVEFPSKSLN